MIWRDGLLPEDAPDFSELLSYDLLSYAYGLLVQGLHLLDAGTFGEAARDALEHAAAALEAVTARGEASPDRDFHRLTAGACYHLARYSARAFSLLHEGLEGANLSRPERALALLMLRDLDGLEALLTAERLDGFGSDAALLGTLREQAANGGDPEAEGEDEGVLLDVVDRALSDNFMGALAVAMLAFERGERALVDDAVARLRTGLSSAGELNLVPHWWCHRLAIHLIGDLWSTSLHERLPPGPQGQGSGGWAEYRTLFIATLYCRSRAEVDLWPSQLEAARRAFDMSDHMVVSLPTSAGKTRVAEL